MNIIKKVLLEHYAPEQRERKVTKIEVYLGKGHTPDEPPHGMWTCPGGQLQAGEWERRAVKKLKKAGWRKIPGIITGEMTILVKDGRRLYITILTGCTPDREGTEDTNFPY